LVVAGSKMTRRAGVAGGEGNFVRKYLTRNNVEQETQKEQAFGRSRWKDLKCNNGIRCRDVKEPPPLRTSRKTIKSIGGRNKREPPRLEGMGNGNEIIWKTCGLEFVNQAVGMSNGLRQIRNWRVWSDRPPSEMEQPDATKNLRRKPLGTTNLKEGAVVVVRE
jgi:hypothetical protein